MGRSSLRDIIDLEATYAGPDAKAMPAPTIAPDGQPIVPVPGAPVAAAPRADARAAGCAGERDPVQVGVRARQRRGRRGRRDAAREGDFDDDDLENSLSLATIEAELKPKLLETFDKVADSYKRLRRLQDQDIENKLKNQSLSPSQERKYKKLKEEIISEVKSLLNQARINSLVEQLYDINKRLVGYEGPADAAGRKLRGCARGFPEELPRLGADPRWLNRVSKFSAKGWKNFVAKDKDRIKHIRGDIHALAGETGLEIQELQDRAHGAEGRARGAPGQERDGGESAPRHLDRQEIHQPRPAVPRPDPGR